MPRTLRSMAHPITTCEWEPFAINMEALSSLTRTSLDLEDNFIGTAETLINQYRGYSKSESEINRVKNESKRRCIDAKGIIDFAYSKINESTSICFKISDAIYQGNRLYINITSNNAELKNMAIDLVQSYYAGVVIKWGDRIISNADYELSSAIGNQIVSRDNNFFNLRIRIIPSLNMKVIKNYLEKLYNNCNREYLNVCGECKAKFMSNNNVRSIDNDLPICNQCLSRMDRVLTSDMKLAVVSNIRKAYKKIGLKDVVFNGCIIPATSAASDALPYTCKRCNIKCDYLHTDGCCSDCNNSEWRRTMHNIDNVTGPIELDSVLDNDFLYGFEVEMESNGRVSFNKKNLDIINNLCSIEHDGSLSNGIEITTPPITGKNGEDLLNGVYSDLRGLGFIPKKTCGAHVHISYPKLTEELYPRLYFTLKNIENLIFGLVPSHRKKNRYSYKLDLNDKSKNLEILDQKSFDKMYYSRDAISDPEIDRIKGYRRPSCRYYWANFHSLYYRGTFENRLLEADSTAETSILWARLNSDIIKWVCSDKFSKDKIISVCKDDNLDSLIKLLEIIGNNNMDFWVKRFKEYCGKTCNESNREHPVSMNNGRLTAADNGELVWYVNPWI